MKELRRLDLSDNKLTTLSGVTLAGVVASGLTHALTELDLSGNAIAAIDKALFAAGWDKLTTLVRLFGWLVACCLDGCLFVGLVGYHAALLNLILRFYFIRQ
jgi:Leucine-rich repeat (LRR) protein